MPNNSICLKFEPAADPVVRPRMDYAFRVFAAIYGYTVVAESTRADVCVSYGPGTTGRRTCGTIHIPARYQVRPPEAKAPTLQKVCFASEEIYLVYGVDKRTGRPDWLGEIFEWLSASLELYSERLDRIGRIPYSASIFQKQGISPFKPYAGLVMAWMESAIRSGAINGALPRAPSPVPDAEHLVICSHDIDFYYTRWKHAANRVGKNLLQSLHPHRSPSFFMSNARLAGRLLRGKRVGHYLPGLLDSIESLGFRSTFFAVSQGRHRRDPDYRIEEIAPELRSAASRGFEVGVHASYDSLSRTRTLKNETQRLEAVMGQKPAGSRQHWLRFERHAKLYKGIQMAGLAYDSSLGFTETCGFRNGANFAFPPYDFESEGPCSFLEIPLAIMDGSLQRSSRSLRRDPMEIAETILGESRKTGWGGISILWHNPMEAIQVPQAINNVFWKCARRQGGHREQWMSGAQFLKASLERYQRAGLLEGVRLDA